MTASRLCKTKVLAVFKTSAIGGHIRFAKVAAKPISTAKPARIIHGTLAITPTGVKVLKYQATTGATPIWAEADIPKVSDIRLPRGERSLLILGYRWMMEKTARNESCVLVLNTKYGLCINITMHATVSAHLEDTLRPRIIEKAPTENIKAALTTDGRRPHAAAYIQTEK